MIVAERAIFFDCAQQPKESVSQFVANLRKAADTCDFPKLKEMIKMD
jgi:hypothetical protein